MTFSDHPTPTHFASIRIHPVWSTHFLRHPGNEALAKGDFLGYPRVNFRWKMTMWNINHLDISRCFSWGNHGFSTSKAANPRALGFADHLSTLVHRFLAKAQSHQDDQVSPMCGDGLHQAVWRCVRPKAKRQPRRGAATAVFFSRCSPHVAGVYHDLSIFSIFIEVYPQFSIFFHMCHWFIHIFQHFPRVSLVNITGPTLRFHRKTCSEPFGTGPFAWTSRQLRFAMDGSWSQAGWETTEAGGLWESHLELRDFPLPCVISRG